MKTIAAFFLLAFCLAPAIALGDTTADPTATVTAVPKASHVAHPVKRKAKTHPAHVSPTPSPSTAPSPALSNAAQPPADPNQPEAWSKKWMDKYIITTLKTDYVHVLLDSDFLHAQFEGNNGHTAMAQAALRLVQTYPFPDTTPDSVKLDVVYFQGRDNYGAPQWDTMKRLGHFEFSRKALAQASPEVFQKAEADWKSVFQAVQFF